MGALGEIVFTGGVLVRATSFVSLKSSGRITFASLSCQIPIRKLTNVLAMSRYHSLKKEELSSGNLFAKLMSRCASMNPT